MNKTAKKPKSIKPRVASAIAFTATLHRPSSPANSAWLFLKLPKEASRKLSSRSKVSVNGTLNGIAFQATLEPDGAGSHWLKVERKLREAAGVVAGDAVALEVTALGPEQEPEPKVPPDLKKALAQAPQKAKDVWRDITPIARRDWIHWVESAKQSETRARRIKNACDMLVKGKRRPCCFDRSGMYDKSLSCPAAVV